MMVFHKKKDGKESRTGYATEDQPVTGFVTEAAMLSKLKLVSDVGE